MALFSTRTGLGLSMPAGVGAGRWVSLALAVFALVGAVGCVEDSTPDEGTPSITIIASNACGKNVLPVATVDDVQAGTLRAMDVIITGSDPASGNRNLVGEGGAPVAVTITAASRGDSNGRGFLVSSRSGGAPFGSISKDVTFSGRNARDQFFCVAAGTVDLTAVVENYRPGGTGAPIAELTTRAAFPVRCVRPSDYFTECGNVADATELPDVEMGVDAADAADASDAGEVVDATTIAAWTVSFVPFANGDSSVIAVRNSGGTRPDTVEVSFRVTESGLPVPNVPVAFTVIGAAAGVQLLPAQVTTNSEGIAATSLVAGNIPGTVQVRATATRVGADGDESQSVDSRSIVIRGGIPSARTLQLTCDDSILLAFRARIETPERMNQRYVYDLPARPGTKCRVTMGDRLQGRLDRDTRVFFLTEAGTVDQEVGIDAEGVGEIEHRISVPAPADVEPLDYEEPYTFEGDEVIMNPRDGLVRIVAFTRGEEDFVDNNADGVFVFGQDSLLPGMDLPEPFVDADDDETWTSNLPSEVPGATVSEIFRDTNQDRRWNGPNNRWDSNTEIWTSTTVLWVGEPAPLGQGPNQNGLKIEVCERAEGCALGNEAPFNPVCGSASPTLHLDYQGSRFTVRYRMRDHNGNCTGGGAKKLEIGPLGQLVYVGGDINPHFLDGPNCFSGFERPGAPDPIWTLALPPQMQAAAGSFGSADVSFIAHYGSIQNNGNVASTTFTSPVRGCY